VAITEVYRWQIFTFLGFSQAQESELWAKIDAVQSNPAKEAHLLSLLGLANEVTGNYALHVAGDAGLIKDGEIGLDATARCRALNEGRSNYQRQMLDLLGLSEQKKKNSWW
jgi:hypothetical protein